MKQFTQHNIHYRQVVVGVLPDGCLDEYRGIVGGVSSVQARGPGPTNSHCLAFTLEAYQKLESPRRVHQVVPIISVLACSGGKCM